MPKYHTDYLATNDAIREQYFVTVRNKFEELSILTTLEEKFEKFKVSITEEAQEDIVPEVKRKTLKKWITNF